VPSIEDGPKSQVRSCTSDEAVARVLETICGRVGRLLARRGLEPGEEATDRPDRLAEESPALAGIARAPQCKAASLSALAPARG
jgi:hypothetical protein